jgi:hypothetical protein
MDLGGSKEAVSDELTRPVKVPGEGPLTQLTPSSESDLTSGTSPKRIRSGSRNSRRGDNQRSKRHRSRSDSSRRQLTGQESVMELFRQASDAEHNGLPPEDLQQFMVPQGETASLSGITAITATLSSSKHVESEMGRFASKRSWRV